MKQFVIEYFHGYDENERCVWSCLVNVKDFNSAKKFGEDYFETVAESTDCLSYEEDIEDALSIKVTPLKSFMKRLKDDAKFLKASKKEIEERAD